MSIQSTRLSVKPPHPSSLNPQPSSLNQPPSSLNPHSSSLNPQPSSLISQPTTLIPQPISLNPQPSSSSKPFLTLITTSQLVQFFVPQKQNPHSKYIQVQKKVPVDTKPPLMNHKQFQEFSFLIYIQLLKSKSFHILSFFIYVECAELSLPQPTTLNQSPTTLIPQLSTLNPHPSTLNQPPSSLNPHPSSLNQPPSTNLPQKTPSFFTVIIPPMLFPINPPLSPASAALNDHPVNAFG